LNDEQNFISAGVKNLIKGSNILHK
jgi:hypothetical protein